MAKKLLLEIDVDDKGNLKIKDLAKSIDKAKKSSKSFGDTLKAILSSQAIFKTINLVTGAIAQMGDEVLDFNKTFLQTQGITGKTIQELDLLKDSVLDISNATELTSVNLAKATLQLSKMGIQDVTDQVAILPVVADLATSSITELERAILVSGQAAKAFGIEMTDLARVANVIQTTVSSTSIDFEDYAQALKFIAPIAKTLGMEIEETSALIGKLGDMGIRGTLAGTTLKNTMLNLLKPGEAVTKELQKMNVKGMSLAGILGELNSRGVSTLDFLDTLGLRAVAGGLGLAGASEAVDKLNKSLDEQEKKVKNVAGVIRGSWIDQMKRVKNLWTNTVLEFSRAFETLESEGALQALGNFFVDLQMNIRANRSEIREFAQVMLKGIVSSFKFLVDNRTAILAVFRIFLVSKLVTNARMLGLAIWDTVRGFMALGNLSAMQTIPRGINQISAAISRMTILIWLAVEANMALDRSLEKWSETIDKQVTNVLDDSVKGFQNKINALKELKKVMLDIDSASSEKEAAKFGITTVQQGKDFFSTGDLGDAAKNKAVSEFLKDQKVLNSQISKISKDFGLHISFFGLTLSALDKTVNHFAKKVHELRGGLTQIESRELSPTGALSEKFDSKRFKEAVKTTADFSQEVPLVESVLKSLSEEKIALNNFSSLLDTFNKGFPNLFSKAIQDTFARVQLDLGTKKLFKGQSAANVLPKANKFSLDPELGFDTSGIDKVTGSLTKLNDSVAITKLEFKDLKNSIDATFENKSLEKFLANLNSSSTQSVELMQKFHDSFIGLQDDMLSRQQDIIDGFTTVVNSVGSATTSILGSLGSMFKSQSDASNKRLEEDKKKLTQWKEDSISKHGQTAEGKYQIERQFDAKMSALEKKQEADRKEAARKAKQLALITSAINIAVGVTNALATGAPYIKWADAAAVALAGGIEIAAISQQQFLNGGPVKTGTPFVDNVPALLSKDEYVLSKPMVDSLGGEDGVEQFIDTHQFGGKRSQTTIIVNNPIGEEEYVRGLFQEISQETNRWGNV